MRVSLLRYIARSSTSSLALRQHSTSKAYVLTRSASSANFSFFRPSLSDPRYRLFSSAVADTESDIENTNDDVNNQKDEENPRFQDIENLHPFLKQGLADMGLETMTEVQAKTYEAASSGQDVLARARTGTGKTIGFLLPALQQLLSNPDRLGKDRVQMLILAPTRELASQIDEQARKVTDFANRQNKGNKKNRISHQVVFGGNPKFGDIRRFERTVPTILVATPGRLRDHLQSTYVNGTPFSELVGETQILVLDETDRLLDMGFKREVDDIISYLPSKDESNRQTLLFSATVPPDVRKVLQATMRTPYVTVDCIHDKDPASHTNSQVKQSHVVLCHQTRLVSGTVEIMLNLIEKERDLKMICFFPTSNLVAFYSALFNHALKIKVTEIHSRKSQSYRTRASDTFRKAKSGILFTSDVSARGVDYPGVTNVLQIGIPDSRESYIHRLGRTGRAGKVGEGLLVLTEWERNFLRSLDGLDIPVDQDVQAMIDGEPKFKDQLDPILASVRSGKNRDLVSSVHKGYSSMLGFYKGQMKTLGIRNVDQLIDFCNGFALQAGFGEVPEMDHMTVQKMGLGRANGLNVVKKKRREDRNGGGGFGGNGRGRSDGDRNERGRSDRGGNGRGRSQW